MAESIHINLTEDIEDDLKNTYQSLCEDLKSDLKKMASELEELCEKTKYEPMVKVVNQTISLFNEDIKGVADQAFDEWVDGEGSFSAAAEKMQAGESAAETAKQIEQDIKDLYDGFWSPSPLGEELQTDTSRPEIRNDDYDTLKDIYTEHSNSVKGLSEDTISNIKSKGSDDPTYNVIIPAVKAITEPVKNAFEQFQSKVDAAKDESEELVQQQSQNNDEASEAATNTSASAADIAESLKMFDDI